MESQKAQPSKIFLKRQALLLREEAITRLTEQMTGELEDGDFLAVADTAKEISEVASGKHDQEILELFL